MIHKLQSNERLLNRVKWFGTFFTYAAAMSVVVSVQFAQQAWPFILYTIGSSVWFFAGLAMKDKPLIWLNFFFILLNMYGVWLRV